tara:strand:+ start:183 stop:1343 length:1161 start_codon:yes stop_codon:yes gene_type:complete
MKYMINLYKRDGKSSSPYSWSATVKLPNPPYEHRFRLTTKCFNKKDAAAEAEGVIERKIKENREGKHLQMKLYEGLRTYVREHSEISNKTWRDDDLARRRLAGEIDGHVALPDVVISMITQGTISSLVSSRLRAGLAASTIRKELVLINAAFKWLKRNKKVEIPDINFNEFTGKGRLKLFTKTRWATPEQLKKVWSLISDDLQRDIFVLLTVTGARLSEVTRLRWDQVSLNEGSIELERTKVDNRSILQLPPIGTNVLTRRYSMRKGMNPWVFPSPKFPSQPMGRPRRIDHAIAASGLNDDPHLVKVKGRFTLHSLRDSFASILAQSGDHQLNEIQELLGHSTPTMTQKYAHLVPSDVSRKAAGTISTTLGGIKTDTIETHTVEPS